MAAVLPAAGLAALGPVKMGVRKTRSGKVLGNPITPPGLKKWYHRVAPVVPANFLKQKIAGLDIDFNQIAPGATHNHTVLRFSFARGPTTRASTLTQAGNVGVQLEWALPPLPPLGPFVPPMALQPGYIKCRGVVGPAPNCAHTVNVPIFAGHTLRRFLRVLYTYDLMRASFNNVAGGSTVGCRDFISQWIHYCSVAGLVNLAAAPAPIWPHFNFLYQLPPAVAATPSLVDWAVYHDPAFVHVLLPGITYGVVPPMPPPASLGPVLLPP